MWKHDYSSSSSQMRWETISWSNNIIRLEKPEARNEILTVALLKVIPLLVQGFSAQTQATKGSQSEKCRNISRGVERKDMSSVHISSDTFFFFYFYWWRNDRRNWGFPNALNMSLPHTVQACVKKNLQYLKTLEPEWRLTWRKLFT